MIKSERSMEAIRMKERLEAIRERALAQINETDSLDKLNDIRVAFLGKKGELTEVLKGMKEVAPEDRPKVGQIVNETRQAIEEVLDKAKTELAAKKRELQLKSEVIDVTLPSKRDELGHKHPNTLALEEIQKIFIGMGYEVVDGPEAADAIEQAAHRQLRHYIPPSCGSSLYCRSSSRDAAMKSCTLIAPPRKLGEVSSVRLILSAPPKSMGSLTSTVPPWLTMTRGAI